MIASALPARPSSRASQAEPLTSPPLNEAIMGRCPLSPGEGLTPVDHPDLWDNVVHLTGRPRPDRRLDEEVRAMTPAQRLESILTEGTDSKQSRLRVVVPCHLLHRVDAGRARIHDQPQGLCAVGNRVHQGVRVPQAGRTCALRPRGRVVCVPGTPEEDPLSGRADPARPFGVDVGSGSGASQLRCRRDSSSSPETSTQ
jgi:hypothetical protein